MTLATKYLWHRAYIRLDKNEYTFSQCALLNQALGGPVSQNNVWIVINMRASLARLKRHGACFDLKTLIMG